MVTPLLSALHRIMVGLALCVVLTLAAVAVPAWAQTPASPGLKPPKLDAPTDLTPEEIRELRRTRQELFLYHYGSRYTFDVVLGGIVGGGIAAALRAGPVVIVAGSAFGSFLGALWFVDRFAADFGVRHGWN